MTVGDSETAVAVHSIAVMTFFISRVLHSIAYVLRLQPWRTVVYFAAIAAVMVMGVNCLVGAWDLAEL